MATLFGKFEIDITKVPVPPTPSGKALPPAWARHRIDLHVSVGELHYEVVRTVDVPPGHNFEAFMKSAEIQNAARQIFAEISRGL